MNLTDRAIAIFAGMCARNGVPRETEISHMMRVAVDAANQITELTTKAEPPARPALVEPPPLPPASEPEFVALETHKHRLSIPHLDAKRK